ncbi:MAG TPA: hypothetical protein VNH20_05855 [Candidatus Dormibacteraeota bacterium]|nr:hypothetical protein [Candidatus Dormibacteraeota bacterium]
MTAPSRRHRDGTDPSALEVVTTSQRPALEEEVEAAFRPLWPEFIFHDQIDREHRQKVEEYFREYDLLLLEGGQVVA